MNMYDWFADNAIDPDSGLCICIATDGVSAASQVMAIGMMSGKLPYTSIFIRGADPYKAERYTGIDPLEYNARAMEESKARRRVAEVIGDHRFLVFKDTPFIEGFMHLPAMQPLDEFVAFDLIYYVRFLDSSRGMALATAPKSDMEELINYMKDKIGGGNFAKGYAFPTVFKRYTGLTDNDIIGEDNLETITKRLYYLYNLLLLQ